MFVYIWRDVACRGHTYASIVIIAVDIMVARGLAYQNLPVEDWKAIQYTEPQIFPISERVPIVILTEGGA